MSWLRRIALSLGILTTVSLAMAGHYYYRGYSSHSHRKITPADPELLRVAERAAVYRPWLQSHGYNSELCFLVDMGMPSGKARFFVYNLRKDSVVLAGMVAHGSGTADFSVTPSFSNVLGSGCTSLGRYKIGYPYKGQFGRAYKLYGLDTSNSQAFSRNVVLHSWSGVPEGETYPYPICNSRGCPMVSPAFLKQLEVIIDKSGKPMGLCIFD